MPTQIITGDNANEATFSGASDGAFKVRVGPNGAKVDGLSVDATGNVDVLAGLTQQGGEAVPRMKQFTAKATTSGTAVDFTGIPSWAKRVTVMLSGVSTNGSSLAQIQIGSGSIDVTGYVGAVTGASTAVSSTSYASGFLLQNAQAAADVLHGAITLSSMGSNIWAAQGTVARNSAYTNTGGGTKTLSGTLDRIRLTTVNGTDTFDAGSVNILVEGY